MKARHRAGLLLFRTAMDALPDPAWSDLTLGEKVAVASAALLVSGGLIASLAWLLERAAFR